MIAIKNAISSMKSHKLRVVIAMIWIIIGITSVVVVSSIGKGLENQINKSVEKSEDGSVILSFYPTNYDIMEVGLVYQPFGTVEKEIISLVSGVKSVTTEIGETDSKFGDWWTGIEKDNEYHQVILSPYDLEKRPEILYGRDFSLDELDRNCILLADETAMLFYDSPEEAVGQMVTLDGKTYEVIGIVPTTYIESFMTSYPELRSYLPAKLIDNMMGDVGWNSGSEQVQINVAKGFNKDDVAMNVINALNEARVDKDGEYVQEWREDSAQELRFIKNAISKFTGIITLVSLVIGGIGIMNIMYMSVIERKREIGIRRAIGAKNKNIVMQFVTEAAVITTIGGLFGIIVGIMVSVYIQGRIPFDVAIDPTMCLFAAFISSLTGILFGVIPAMKATKVDPIKAIQG